MPEDAVLLQPGKLEKKDIERLYYSKTSLAIDDAYWQQVEKSAQRVQDIVSKKESVYGINTGFGYLADKKIGLDNLEELQKRLVLSHAAGVGEYLSASTVRLILAFKINSLARAYSGISTQTLKALFALYNNDVLPCVPAKGSVGASGDLAPLAHIACCLLGEGEVLYRGKIIPALKGLKKIKLKPLILGPKEGLALVNGTQVSTALAWEALLKTERVFKAAIISGCLTTEATLSSHIPFHEKLQALRGQQGQIEVAENYRHLLQDSNINASHHNCSRVQDPYSIRCQPQVMGACLDQMHYAEMILLREANAVSDNPIILKNSEVISGGNFHAEPVAFVADALACAISEIGSLAERRIELLMDKHFSLLPAFLVDDAGLNSGFMVAQVTAAALVSENKQLSHPASVDSIPTSANQEDHVSMATHGARRLLTMVDNTANVIAIELLAAAQGIDFRRPLTTSIPLEGAVTTIRQAVPHYEHDRYLAPDIAAVQQMVLSGQFSC